MKKKSILIILIILLVIITVTTIVIFANRNSSLEKQLSKTEYIKLVYVRPRNEENTGKENKITNKEQINKIVDIVLKGQEVKDTDGINLDGAPHYRLTFYNKKDQIIEEIEYNYYATDNTDNKEDNSSYITLKNNKNRYYIDNDALLSLIDP